MGYLVLGLVLLLIVGGVIGTLVWTFSHEQKQRRQEFRQLLLHRLQTTPPQHFDLLGLADQAGVSAGLARQVAEELYGQFFARAVADARITPQEQRQLDQLAAALQIEPHRRAALEHQAKENKFLEQLHKAMADGVVTEEEIAQLDQLREALGIAGTSAQAEAVSLQVYLDQFRKLVRRSTDVEQGIDYLARLRQVLRLDSPQAREQIHREALNIYRQCFFEIKQDGHISQEEEKMLKALQQLCGLPDAAVAPYLQEIERIRFLERCREGQLPSCPTSKLLDSGEICHWEGPATYVWKTSTQTKSADGELTITSERVLFTSPLRSFDFKPRRIVDVALYGDGVYVRTSSRTGTGAYLVGDPPLVEAVLVGVVRKHKFLVSEQFSSERSRHIPDRVKREVWARDGGRCVKCGATEYLEFDHIIPFSKGGANTTNNIQLLCRKCNLLKGDRLG